MKPNVIIEPIEVNIRTAVRRCFENEGGIEGIVKGNVFIKTNANTMVNSMTHPEVVLAVVELIRESSSNVNKIYVMDNCTIGAFTRLIFQYADFAKRIKKAGAIPLYLDEQKSVPFDFNGKVLNSPVPIPKILFENLIENRDRNTCINIPRLKSHIFTGITVCVKNQYGILYDREKMDNHQLIDQKLVDLLRIFRPDYNIVDAVSVVNSGPVAIFEDWIVPMGLIIGGRDAVAVDTVCSQLIGITPVKHLELAGQEKLGTNEVDEIQVLPSMDIIHRYKIQLRDSITFQPPYQIKILRGAGGYCHSACRYLDSVFLLLSQNSDIGPCVGIYGRGHCTKTLDSLSGPFIVNGPCAVSELKDYFEQRRKTGDITVYFIKEHLHIAKMFSFSGKAMGVKLKDMTGIFQSSIPKIMLQSFIARLHGARNISYI